jgi:hypothetical protein
LDFGWAALPPNGILDLKDDFHAHHRPGVKKPDGRPITKKCGSPIQRSLMLGLSFAETGCRTFLFPIFENIIQCLIQCCLHTFFHNAHDFRFEDGLLFLFVFLSFFKMLDEKRLKIIKKCSKTARKPLKIVFLYITYEHM